MTDTTFHVEHQDLLEAKQRIQANAKAGIVFREGVFMELTASPTPDGPWQPNAMRCHPWVAVALDALTPEHATELAAELEETLAKGFPAWRGWGIEYPGQVVGWKAAPVTVDMTGGRARAYIKQDCPACGTEKTLHTLGPWWAWRCPNPECP